MAMNGIGQYDLFKTYQYNRVHEQEAQNLQSQEPKKEAVASVQEPQKEMPLSLNLNLEGIRAKQNISLNDARLSMNQPSGSSYEMKSLSFRGDNDEMDKALSDMQKDSALMQYSYFVGDSNVITDDEDGVVLRKPSV